MKKIHEQLNKLLGTYAVFYQNVKMCHWMIKGKNFYELHEEFGDLYEEADDDLDSIAERILMIDGIPLQTYSEFVSHSIIPEERNVSRDIKAIDLIIKNLEKIVELEKSIISHAMEIEDHGTADLLIKFLGMQEKTLWKLSSHLE